MRQMKYTRAEKLKIAKEHVIDNVSLNEISKKCHDSASIINAMFSCTWSMAKPPLSNLEIEFYCEGSIRNMHFREAYEHHD